MVDANESESKVPPSIGKVSTTSFIANGNGKSSIPLSGIHEYVASQGKHQSVIFEDDDVEHFVQPFVSENKPPLDIKKSVIVSEHRITRNLKNINMSFVTGDSDHLINSKGKLQIELDNLHSFREFDKNSYISLSSSPNKRSIVQTANMDSLQKASPKKITNLQNHVI